MGAPRTILACDPQDPSLYYLIKDTTFGIGEHLNASEAITAYQDLYSWKDGQGVLNPIRDGYDYLCTLEGKNGFYYKKLPECADWVEQEAEKDGFYVPYTAPLLLQVEEGEAPEITEARASVQVYKLRPGLEDTLCRDKKGIINYENLRKRSLRSDVIYGITSLIAAISDRHDKISEYKLQLAVLNQQIQGPVSFFNYPFDVRALWELAGLNALFGIFVPVANGISSQIEAKWTAAGRGAFESQKRVHMESIRQKLDLCGNIPQVAPPPPAGNFWSRFTKLAVATTVLPATYSQWEKFSIDAERIAKLKEDSFQAAQKTTRPELQFPDYNNPNFTDDQLDALTNELNTKFINTAIETARLQQQVEQARDIAIAKYGLPDGNVQEMPLWHYAIDSIPIGLAFAITIPKLSGTATQFFSSRSNTIVWEAAKADMKGLINQGTLTSCSAVPAAQLITEIDNLPVPAINSSTAMHMSPVISEETGIQSLLSPTLLKVGAGASAVALLGGAVYLSMPYVAPYIASAFAALSFSTAATVGSAVVLAGLVAFAGYNIYQQASFTA